MEIRITTLVENQPDDRGELINEHGLSIFIEFDKKRILFDTGQTDAVISNAEKLNIDLSSVDYLLLSHGHYDHTGGVMPMLKRGVKPKHICMGKGFFEKKYKKTFEGKLKYIGETFTQNELERTGAICEFIGEDITKISDKIYVLKNFESQNDFEMKNPKFTINGEVDDFLDEIVLVLDTSKGLMVIAGCSHVGIVNIISAVKKRIDKDIYMIIGGTHMVEADSDRIDKTINAFRKYDIANIAVSHCTGENGLERFCEAFGDSFINNNTGNIIVF